MAEKRSAQIHYGRRGRTPLNYRSYWTRGVLAFLLAFDLRKYYCQLVYVNWFYEMRTLSVHDRT